MKHDFAQPTVEEGLTDSFGRRFPYLRLSITDVCNFRCGYCLPNGYQCDSKPTFLSGDEIQRLINAFAEMGVYKVRLTGGEPTVRKDFIDIARIVSSHPSIQQRAFTTNGFRLHRNAKAWRDAGLTHISVSVDSLHANRFHAITGHDRLPEVLKGVDAAIEAGFKAVKINVILLNHINNDELKHFIAWAKDTPISIRFIELMQTGDNRAYFQKHHFSATTVERPLLDEGWSRKRRPPEAGPAKEYTHPDYRGSIGFITPYSKDFCKGCNRLRITAIGDLRLCLFGNQGVPLRQLLQHDEQKPLLKQRIHQQLVYKESSHFLAYGDTGMTPHLAAVGG